MRGLLGLCWMAALGVIAFSAPATATPDHTAPLHVMVIDEDAQDWVVLRNTSDCATLSGHARIDFTPSQGGVVIDTAYGGAGTRDPGGVEVLSGPVAVAPVADGARVLDIAVLGLPPQGEAIITLDIDNERGWFENARVMATPQDIQGSVAEFRRAGSDGTITQAVLSDGRQAILPVVAECEDGASDPSATPMS